MTGPYDDIINLPHPTSAKHPRMPLSDRAAQFAPFAALSGHSAALVETARLTDQRMELDEDARAALDSKQQLLLERIKERPEITVTWFQPDAKKDGGRYILLVFMYDRLGRNLNETPFIAEWFTKKGIHVWSVYEGEIIDGVDAERMLDYIRFWQTDEAQKL